MLWLIGKHREWVNDIYREVCSLLGNVFTSQQLNHAVLFVLYSNNAPPTTKKIK